MPQNQHYFMPALKTNYPGGVSTMATVIERRVEAKQTVTVTFTNTGQQIECPKHTNLRELAIQNDIDLYNGLARYTNLSLIHI